MNSWPPSSYYAEAEKLGVTREVAEQALSQAHVSQEKGYPAILTLGHLAFHTKTPVGYLRTVVGRQHDPYRVFATRKRAGGVRHICVAEPELAQVLRWLHRYVLRAARPHSASHAYTPGASPLTCAQQHSSCQWLVKMDIRQFFESVSEIQVYRIFREIGYTSLVAFELARLTTRVVDSEARYKRRPWQRHSPSRSRIAAYHSTRIGHLPQGASTSPMLANLAMRKIDSEITQLATSFGLTYTRYSDDLTFSSASSDFNREKARQLIKAVYRVMSLSGLRPHTAKTAIIPPGARKVVLGLLVDTSAPRLTRAFRDKIECHLHFLEKLGPQSHAQKRGFRTVLGLRRHIDGLLSYARSVDRAFGDEMIERFTRVKWPL